MRMVEYQEAEAPRPLDAGENHTTTKESHSSPGSCRHNVLSMALKSSCYNTGASTDALSLKASLNK
jgi:hypothetical protein